MKYVVSISALSVRGGEKAYPAGLFGQFLVFPFLFSCFVSECLPEWFVHFLAHFGDDNEQMKK